jgi:CelD/BcsL family acetyltransferase involved in cellulose biosynthesis
MSIATVIPRAHARSPEIAPYQARQLSYPEEVASIWDIVGDHGSLTAYQRLDWIERVVRHLAKTARAEPIFIVVAERTTGRVIALVPLALTRRFGLRTVSWLDLGVCDYAAPVIAPGWAIRPHEAVAFWAAVRAVLPPADLIQIERIPATVEGMTNPLALLPGAEPMTMHASGVAIEGDPATLLARLCRPSTLKDLGKQRRRLERAGPVRFACAGTPADVDALFDALVEQRRSRFAAMGRFDLLIRQEVQDFYRDAAHDGLTGGAARLLGLSVDGQWIAAAYCLVHRGTLHGLLLTTTSEDRWRNTSPGAQIVTECLRWAREQGLDYFDFTVGNHAYKQDFGVESRELKSYRSALTLAGRCIASLETAGERVMQTVERYPAVYSKLRAFRRAIRRI